MAIKYMIINMQTQETHLNPFSELFLSLSSMMNLKCLIIRQNISDTIYVLGEKLNGETNT